MPEEMNVERKLTEKQKAKIVEYQRMIMIARNQLDTFVNGLREGMGIPERFVLNPKTFEWVEKNSVAPGAKAEQKKVEDGKDVPAK